MGEEREREESESSPRVYLSLFHHWSRPQFSLSPSRPPPEYIYVGRLC